MKGIKTGWTTTAGPCLATYVIRGGWELIVVLLGCKSLEARWSETNKLVNWTVLRMNKINE